MGKTGKNKKRRADATASSTADAAIGDLCNVSGLDGGGEDVDDLFACMAEMDDEVEAGGGADSADDDEAAGHEDTKVALGQSKHSKPKIQSYSMDEITLIPIRVELLRHKLMGELSSCLLDQVKGLRMPTFERWLIDAKLEEREKRKAGSTKLPPFDPVLPSAAEMVDGSTQRLMREICDFLSSSSSSSKYDEEDEEELAERICLELCRRSAEAAMEVNRMEMRLSTTGATLSFAAKGRGWKRGKKKKKGKPNKERINLEKGEEGTYALVYERRLAKDKKKTKRHEEDDSGDDSEDDDDKNEKGTKSSGGSKPFVVKINASHYNKLRSMFDAVHPIRNQSTIHTFHHLVFSLLLRYSSLAGGHLLNDLRGGGMQGSIQEKAFEFLGEFCAEIGHTLAGECFASPLNANLGVGMYRSGFYRDIDKHFGSIGDFFLWKSSTVGKNNNEWYEANPPFAPGLMREMVVKMLEHLEAADEKKRALSFVIIVPACDDADATSRDAPVARQFAAASFNAMLQSEYQSHHILLGSGDHGYVEGAQHLRPTRFKTSMYDTSVILLQSKQARRDMKLLGGDWKNQFEKGIRSAFQSGHESETFDRKRIASKSSKRKDIGKVGREESNNKKNMKKMKSKKRSSLS